MKTNQVMSFFLALLLAFCLTACGGSGNRCTYEGVSVELPEDFVVEDNDPDDMFPPVAYGPNFPQVRDNISFTSSFPESIDDYSSGNIKDKIYPEGLSFGISNVQITDFTKTTIDGTDAVKCSSSLTSGDGVDMKQTVVIIFKSDKTVSVVFTSVTGLYDDEFAKGADSIAVK